jgi:predicted CoA-binding protein
MQENDAVISASAVEIKKIFSDTKNIAIIGLSPKVEKESNQVARYLQQAGFRIIPVNPQADYILGEKVYGSLAEIREPIGIVDIFRRPEFIAAIIDEVLARKDVKCGWTQLGLIDNSAARKALAAGICVVQDRCTKIEHLKLFGSASSSSNH